MVVVSLMMSRKFLLLNGSDSGTGSLRARTEAMGPSMRSLDARSRFMVNVVFALDLASSFQYKRLP
jgi:hypothetical protein